jgi:hypothetical protein
MSRPACNSSPTLVDSNSISGWVRSWRWFNQPNVTTRCPPPWLLRRLWRLRLAKVPSKTFRYGLHNNRSRTIHVLQSHIFTKLHRSIPQSDPAVENNCLNEWKTKPTIPSVGQPPLRIKPNMILETPEHELQESKVSFQPLST